MSDVFGNVEAQNDIHDIIYNPSPTIKRFMLSSARDRGILGPIGSGKSVGCLIELARQAKLQEPSYDGIRHTKYAIIRNTKQQLRDTTLQTFYEWFPNGIAGVWKEYSMTFFMRYDDVECQFLFRSLDKLEDVNQVLSLELSGVYLNEAREIKHEQLIFDIRGRIDRYPSRKAGGPGTTRPLFIFDTNGPDEDHWIHQWHKVRPPKKFEMFVQPSARSPYAENLANLSPTYYEDKMDGATKEWIRIYIDGEYGPSKIGKPVFANFRKDMHVRPMNLEPNPLKMVIIGMDFGLNPAAVIKQADDWGHVNTLDECFAFDMGLKRFMTLHLEPLLRERYVGYQVAIIGDPSGKVRNEVTEISCFKYLRNRGYVVKPAPSNLLAPRFQAVDDTLTVMANDMRPRCQINPRCTHLIAGHGGTYHYELSRKGVAALEPKKNDVSHIEDANQYADMFYIYGMTIDPTEFGVPDRNDPFVEVVAGDVEAGY